MRRRSVDFNFTCVEMRSEGQIASGGGKRRRCAARRTKRRGYILFEERLMAWL